MEYGESLPLPPDWQQPAEWTFARLMYPPGPLDGYRGRFDGDWRQGLSLWTQDYPRADRAFSQAVRRLTRVDARSVEQPVNLDDGDEIYNWPWLYAVQVGEWGLTEPQAKKLRDYLLRGGFFMADDFHGTQEQAYFEKTMKMVFPDRPIVDIPNDDPIFHTVFDLNDRYRITGAEHLAVGYKNGRQGRALGGHLRRQGPRHDGDFPEFGHRRFLGMVGRSAVSAEILRPRNAHRRELRRLRDDPLMQKQLCPQARSRKAPGSNLPHTLVAISLSPAKTGVPSPQYSVRNGGKFRALLEFEKERSMKILRAGNTHGLLNTRRGRTTGLSISTDVRIPPTTTRRTWATRSVTGKAIRSLWIRSA